VGKKLLVEEVEKKMVRHEFIMHKELKLDDYVYFYPTRRIRLEKKLKHIRKILERRLEAECRFEEGW